MAFEVRFSSNLFFHSQCLLVNVDQIALIVKTLYCYETVEVLLEVSIMASKSTSTVFINTATLLAAFVQT